MVSTEVSSWFELAWSSATFQDSPHCSATDELCHRPEVPLLSSGVPMPTAGAAQAFPAPKPGWWDRFYLWGPGVLPLWCSQAAGPQGAPSPHSALAITACQLWNGIVPFGFINNKNNYSWQNKEAWSVFQCIILTLLVCVCVYVFVCVFASWIFWITVI